MSDNFLLFDEPMAVFANGKLAADPHDGLALFGAFDSDGLAGEMSSHAVIGTKNGIELWHQWSELFNGPSCCTDISRHRPWPPFTGFDVAFGASWPKPSRAIEIDEAE